MHTKGHFKQGPLKERHEYKFLKKKTDKKSQKSS
jgi:hypothetical protein